MDVMLGYQKYVARATFPGFTGALFSTPAQLFDGPTYMVFPAQEIQQIGNLPQPENNAWIEREYHPHVW
ncbi:MAG TPA: hypothetical protein VG713_13855 [Pirellulales bacterium]|nr:hypothetical protein [Pirellulales bacterium]